jgi:nucleoid-associated protein
MITINRTAIHEIVKESHVNSATTFITNACLSINDTTKDFVKKLHESYKSDSVVYALFNLEPDSYFPNEFIKYNTKKANTSFLTFTQNVTKNLKNKIAHVTLAKGGFLIYVDYENSGTNYLGVFLIRDAQGVVFNKDEIAKNVAINSVTYMNTEKLVMACRINLDKFESKDGKYLTFLRRGQAEISEYFFDWICSEQPESSKDFTESLYNIVSLMPLPLNPDTKLPIDINIYRQKLVNYIREKNRIVDLRDLGKYFYDNESIFTDYRDKNLIDIDNEFKADGNALRKFNLVDIEASGIQLKFSRGILKSGKIKIGVGEQVIIKSKELQAELQKELDSN